VGCLELIDRGLKFPGFTGWKTDLAIRGRPHGQALLIIKDELDADPVEVFGRAVYRDAAEIPHTELVGGPTHLPGLDRVLFLAIGCSQTGNEQDGFHAAVKAVHSLARARNLEPERTAAKMAVTIHISTLRHHNLFSFAGHSVKNPADSLE
jgi:hypothetical protein